MAEEVRRGLRLCRAHLEEQDRQHEYDLRTEQLMICIAKFCGIKVSELSCYQRLGHVPEDDGPPPQVDPEEMKEQLNFVTGYIAGNQSGGDK